MSESRTAVVAGVGLIGGSVGLALTRSGWDVIGIDTDEARLARACEIKAIRSGVTPDGIAGLPVPDLGVVATGVQDIAEVAGSLLGQGARVVTDVGSVKAPIAEAVADRRFVPGHPMAGSEQHGLSGASADMFNGTTWVLTPTPETDDEAFAEVREIVAGLGAYPIVMPPDRHDRLVAVVSHVPHLTAATLMRIADERSEEHRALLRLAAGGFRDMTRVAAGHPSIWPDICAHNQTAIVEVLDRLIVDLAELRDVVADADTDRLLSHLEAARRARRNLPSTVPGAEAMSEMRIPVLDRKGEIAAIATLAADLDVNISDLEIAHSAEGPRGVMVIIVETESAERMRTELVKRGYRPSVQSLD